MNKKILPLLFATLTFSACGKYVTKEGTITKVVRQKTIRDAGGQHGEIVYMYIDYNGDGYTDECIAVENQFLGIAEESKNNRKFVKGDKVTFEQGVYGKNGIRNLKLKEYNTSSR
jgi:hypothetical protein